MGKEEGGETAWEVIHGTRSVLSPPIQRREVALHIQKQFSDSITDRFCQSYTVPGRSYSQFGCMPMSLCPRDDSQGAFKFAPVCPSVCLYVSASVHPFVTLYGIGLV